MGGKVPGDDEKLSIEAADEEEVKIIVDPPVEKKINVGDIMDKVDLLDKIAEAE